MLESPECAPRSSSASGIYLGRIRILPEQIDNLGVGDWIKGWQCVHEEEVL
jgi:hypothetical protein